MATPAPKAVPAPVRPPQPVKPPTVLLMGPPGSGKTDSLATLLETGLEVFLLVIEANGLDTFLDSIARRNLKTDRLHWKYIPPASPDLGTLMNMAEQISTKDFESLSSIKTGIGKEKAREYMTFLKALENFVDDKDGKSYGSVFDFDDSKVLAIDSLSGLNAMAMDLTIGYKPTASKPEWGIAMNLELKTLQKLCADLRCLFVLTAHIDKEPNEITGANTVTSAALGQKNSGKIARLFSEVVLTKRGKTGREFKWSTWETSSLVDLKNRALPISDSIDPTFVRIWKAHQRRLTQVETVT